MTSRALLPMTPTNILRDRRRFIERSLDEDSDWGIEDYETKRTRLLYADISAELARRTSEGRTQA